MPSRPKSDGKRSSVAPSGSPKTPRILAVKASAGAGKTYQLTVRFLSLLKRSHLAESALRQIVAITFTNRAAAEMKERIIRALKEIAFETPDGKAIASRTGLTPSEAAAWLEVILNHFGDFQVRTIDSLIYTVMRAFSVEMGLPPELDVDFEKDAMLDRCFDRLLASIDWENRNDRNREIIGGLVDAYLYVDRDGGIRVEDRIRRRLKQLYDSAIEASSEVERPDLGGALERLSAAGADLLALMRQTGFLACFPKNQHIEAYLESPRDHFGAAFWKKNSLGDVSKAAGQFHAMDLTRLDRLFGNLKAAREQFLHCHACARVYPYVLALRELRKEVGIQTECEGVILGGNWIDRAYEYLKRGEDAGRYAFLKIGSRVHHFLIDEFQDTSRKQWETLAVLLEESLSTGGTLFYVGDVKQAIYGWRGGDWRLFDEVLMQPLPVAKDERREEALEVNYRSLPRIVEFNNRLYATLLDPEFVRSLSAMMLPDEATEKDAEELASILLSNFRDVVESVRDDLDAKAGTGRVLIERFSGTKEDLYLAIEAALRPQIRAAWDRRKKGIAVLVRENDQAEAVAAWLVAEGIPIVTENSLRLKASPLIKGIVSFLHFLEYPLDDLSFWGALASPLFAGLPETPSDALGPFLRAGGWSRPLYKVFEDSFPKAYQELVRPLLARSGFLAPYDLVREVLEAFRTEARYPLQAVFTNRFLEVVFQAEAKGATSLSTFLEFWDESAVEEKVGLPEDLSAVRILTIHKAKGLEFPVVFVPFTSWRRRPDKEAVTEAGELVLLAAPRGTPLSQDLIELRLKTGLEDAIENLNLLYVATTRPREELYLYVTHQGGGKPSKLYLATWLETMLTQAGLLE